MKRIALAIVLLLSSTLLAFDPTPVPVSPDGINAVIDLPTSQHMRNTGGSDGSGLCVYTAVTMAARWQNVTSMFDFRKFAEGRPGGSYPEKLASDIKTYSARNGRRPEPYVQHTGGDETFLDLCMKTRRAACITYAGNGDGFYDSTVAHMLLLAELDATHAATIDNNRPGFFIWMTRTQLLARWKGLNDDGTPSLVPFHNGLRLSWAPVGGGWMFAWLAPPPPPVAPTAVPPIPAPKPLYVWERELIGDGLSENDLKPYWFLYRAGELVYVVEPDGSWHKADGRVDGGVIVPPAGVPSPPFEASDDFNKGIHFTKLRTGCRYWVGETECSRAKAYAAVSDPGDLIDDSDKYHLSIIGDKTLVDKWFAGPLAKYTKRLHVQCVASDSWIAKERLHSAVTLQEPAKIGGRIVGTAIGATLESVSSILADVFDPPAPKPIDPPKPDDAVPAPVKTIPAIGLALIAFALLIRRKQ